MKLPERPEQAFLVLIAWWVIALGAAVLIGELLQELF
jgi:hypothetical protein